MPESRLTAPEAFLPSEPDGSPISNVSFNDLARLPAERLARLLLDRAAEDPTLLGRLFKTIGLVRNSPVCRSSAIIGESAAMRRITSLVRRFGQTDEPVLITGESGTGKELLARSIHDGSRRSKGPFVALNCAAIPSGLVASELFGHEKGAFTGAVARSLGQIEVAQRGTLFLDEIGDMPLDLQGHLLRFLQEGEIRRVGGRDTISLDVRVVSATNVRLGQAIADGRFREDLFYRLNVLTLPVPPLRERAEDIALLANHFLSVAGRDFCRHVDGFSAEAMDALRRYHWPGNVRQLMSMVRRAVVVGDGPLVELPSLEGLDAQPTAEFATTSVSAIPTLKPGSAEERIALLSMLERSGENITLTADALGVSRVTLYRMLRRHDIVLKRGLAGSPIGRRPQYASG